ncbi:isoleucine--tRNA ligase [Terriglobus albidus]|uniref:Isoleucine--tRNA ligase n=1 Tax=Terriglobus albidus TaxID=1592106 RepID=A0A5B9EG90_9BACT|nr:isoleucine--tRNA ligase [Terriglobus albidus]QEE29076.1 isoleucine--tRNA ligase [Terriglobus albidus]
MSDSPAQKPLKSTLNLPQTAFPMKAGLPQNEPARLQKWIENDLYGQIRAARAGAPKYILHDGPPYANGAIHLGHALNKCIKDFVVKSKTMTGFDSPYVPGWDCHGLPIEIKVDEQLGRKKLEMDAVTVRQQCRDYAQKYVDLQRSQFRRMGVLGRWDDPYLTMSFPYEARIVETFYEFFEHGYVYKGLKPVYWCWHDKTALAEAEVEYEQHTSPSIYVRYRLLSDPADLAPELAGREVYTIIYTTTPWTLPSSLAVAFNPEFDYVALENTDGAVYLVAEALADAVRESCKMPEAKVLTHMKGTALENITFAHPFLHGRTILGVLGDHVTAEQGTGAVHTAPAHGPDDFYTGAKYGLPQTTNVDDAGRIRNGLPEYDGLHIYKANPIILDIIRKNGALLSETEVKHSYPHCWRCHRPVIYRATEQWFIGMETPVKDQHGNETTFRQRALDEIKKVTWDPSWGEERISNMIATRPDWCISRQRIWGVPIAVFLCQSCDHPISDKALNQSIVKLFEKEGADAWYEYPAEQLLSAGTTCIKCGHAAFRKEMDILDVWFESGSSWHAVLETEPELRFPADMYTEGGDQHRGWFHSSLLASVGIRNAAPYKYVATSGWTLDEQRRAFSKSLGNGVDPVLVMDQLGGDIVRLWVASVDFREDVIASVPLMKRLAEEIYRKLRNTFRILLANLYDFNPAEHAVKEFSALEPLDRYMLAKGAEIVAKVRKAYDEFEFHRAYHAINEFCNSDLSAFYIDVLKDRLYTFAPNAPGRRSAQTAIWKITEALVRLVAPVLSFTADEVWEYLPKVEGREASVHIAHFPAPEDLAPANTESLVANWEKLLAVRDTVLLSLEEARKNKQIGKALDASVAVTIPAALKESFDSFGSHFAELCNVSAFRFSVNGDQTPSVEVTPCETLSDITKCERCWRYTNDVASDSRYPTVCARCATALDEIGYEPYTVTQEQPV